LSTIETVQCVVIGAGVVGLACARELALAGLDVIIIEANYAIGMETSSRNSEVIHSGIYYPTGSLKAEACVRGRDMLYDYCAAHNIEHKKMGKLIVATTQEEYSKIKRLKIKGQENGVTDLELLTREQTLAMEPNLNCIGALWSPSTGIVDSHSVMLAMQGDIEDHGGMIAFKTRVTSGDMKPNRCFIPKATYPFRLTPSS
jgi:L-2-hydroxyglutarate oxidase LhgO